MTDQERMSDEQIEAATKPYALRCDPVRVAIEKTGRDMQQLRTDAKRLTKENLVLSTALAETQNELAQANSCLREKDALLADAPCVMKNLIYAVEAGYDWTDEQGENPYLDSAREAMSKGRDFLSRLTTANERREQGEGERGGCDA